MDPSLKPDRDRKGSYYRKIEDVLRALNRLQSNKLPETMRFFAYYFGCEKIARGLIGIHSSWPARKAYHHRQPLRLADIKKASVEIGLQISMQDIDWLFADFNEQHLLQAPSPSFTKSARCLRNTLTHDFGPFNVDQVALHASFHNPRMQSFIGCIPTILNHLQVHFAHVQ